MRSGKPPAPWRRRKTRGISLLRIAATSLLLAVIGAAALWYAIQPEARTAAVVEPTWQTPVLDIANWENRVVLAEAQNNPVNTMDGRWIGSSCFHQPDHAAFATLLLGREARHLADTSSPASRLLIQLWPGKGRITTDRLESNSGPVTRRQITDLDSSDAAALLSLIKESGYAEMSPANRLHVICNPGGKSLMQSCINGRYYAVLRECERTDDTPNFGVLADRIDNFIATRSKLDTP